MKRSSRTIAIGDIHGCLPALQALLTAVDPQPDDTVVTMGDYVDRGPDSPGVIDELIALDARCRYRPLLGNHDEMLLDICSGQTGLLSEWVLFGGDATLTSYGGRVPHGVPPVERPRHGVHVGVVGHRLMERSVKHGYVRDVW